MWDYRFKLHKNIVEGLGNTTTTTVVPLHFGSTFVYLQDIHVIFTNIIDIYEFTVMFAGLLENAIEMADQDPSIVAPVGECFEDMTEVMDEFCFEWPKTFAIK